MGQHVLKGNPPVELTLRRSARARRISLRVSGLDGQVTLTLPRGVRDAEALEFAQSKAAWLRSKIGAHPGVVYVEEGVNLPIEGRMVRIDLHAGRRIVLSQDRLTVPAQSAMLGAKVQAWLKTRARDRLAHASDIYAKKLGRPFSRLTIRDTRSRWGSCSSGGGLMYSWRLIMAPPEVLEYVAAHEVAHLQEMNHSRAFWALVDQLYPGYDAPRRWLRENGAELHRYRFND